MEPLYFSIAIGICGIAILAMEVIQKKFKEDEILVERCFKGVCFCGLTVIILTFTKEAVIYSKETSEKRKNDSLWNVQLDYSKLIIKNQERDLINDNQNAKNDKRYSDPISEKSPKDNQEIAFVDLLWETLRIVPESNDSLKSYIELINKSRYPSYNFLLEVHKIHKTANRLNPDIQSLFDAIRPQNLGPGDVFGIASTYQVMNKATDQDTIFFRLKYKWDNHSSNIKMPVFSYIYWTPGGKFMPADVRSVALIEAEMRRQRIR